MCQSNLILLAAVSGSPYSWNEPVDSYIIHLQLHNSPLLQSILLIEMPLFVCLYFHNPKFLSQTHTNLIYKHAH